MNAKDATPSAVSEDRGRKLLELMVDEIIRQFENSPGTIPAATLNVARQILSDGSITLAHLKRGDFEALKTAAGEQFPFDTNGDPIALN